MFAPCRVAVDMLRRPAAPAASYLQDVLGFIREHRVHMLPCICDVLSQQLHRQQRPICCAICRQFQPYCQRQPLILVSVPTRSSPWWAAKAALRLLL